jgi:tetratricopeptide (TPR) repeat protein/tRNA A-37 threonylcarbamoyl transferase component Bud32
LSAEIRIDTACQAFETAWKAAARSGSRPRIEDYLATVEEGERWPLLRELVALELHYRRQEPPSLEEYPGRFPQYASELRAQLAEAGLSPTGRGKGRPGSVPPASADHNLLFGVLALQMDFVSRDALIRAMQAWVFEKAKPLVQILTEQGALSVARQELLEALVREHLQQHGDDPQQSLAALSSLGSARADLAAIADADVQASLAHVAKAQSERTLESTVNEASGRRTEAGQRFRFLRPHDKGGLSEVSVAMDEELHREVALKEIQAQFADHPESRARFLLEAEVTGGLEHPGVVPVYSLGTYSDQRPFYAMRFIKGHSLKEAIKGFHRSNGAGRDWGGDGLALRELLGRFVDVCNAMAYAHSRGVLHRDLKPGNIMLGPFGETLVVDWGLAKVVGRPEGPAGSAEGTLRPPSAGDSAPTEMGRAVGTPAYMSPEQAAGKTDELGPATDIYSLGATLYALLTNGPPVPGTDNGEVMRKVQQGDWKAPRAVNRAIPPALDAICCKAMALCPAERYAKALDLAEDVQRYLAGEVVSAYREGLPARAWRWAKRHRRLLARTAVAVMVLAVVLGSAAWVWQAEHQSWLAKQEAEVLRQREEAQDQIAKFRRLADEMTFYAANTNPVGERTPYYDPDSAEAVGRDAEAIVRGWGLTLENVAIADEEHEPLKEEVYDFLLLMAQLKMRPGAGQQSAQETRYLLKRAHALQERSRSYYRLSADCSRLLGDLERAEQDQRQADDPNTRYTTLDHFLMGEQKRTHATRTDNSSNSDPELENSLRDALKEYALAVPGPRQAYWAHFHMGRCYLGLGEADRALQAFAACTALRPKVPWAASARGMALARQSHFKEAESELNQVLEQHADFAPARLNLGAVYWLQKKYEPALEQFKLVLDLPQGKRLVEAAYYRGLVCLERGDRERNDFDEALQDLQQVIKEKPTFLPAYLARAKVYFARGEEGLGIEDLNKFVHFDPKEAKAWAERGRLLNGIPGPKALAAALRDLRQAEKLDPKTPDLFNTLGDVLYRKAQLDEMIAANKQKRKFAPENVRLNAAIDAYSTGLESAPKNLRLRANRGWAHVNDPSKNYGEAREDFTVAIGVEPRTAFERLVVADAHTGLGYIHACKGETTKALEEATRATLAARTIKDHEVLYVNHYRLRHNLACIYGELSRSGDKYREDNEQLAVDFLREAVALAQHVGASDEERGNIENEPAFPDPLRQREDFKALQKNPGR